MKQFMKDLLHSVRGRIIIGLAVVFVALFIIFPTVVVTTAQFGDKDCSSQLFVEDDGPTPVSRDDVCHEVSDGE